MQKQEVSDKPLTEEPYAPQWVPPPAPTPGGREWLVMFAERFGFLIVCVLTVGVLAILFVNSDLLLRTPDAGSDRSAAEAEGTPVEVEEAPPAAQSLAVAEPDTAAVVTASLSITTDPASAAIFVDGEFVGVTPLRGVTLPEGQHLISAQKQDYVLLDTFVTLASPSASLDLTLEEAEIMAEAPAGAEDPPADPASDDPVAEAEQPPETPTPPAEEEEQPAQEQSTPPPTEEEVSPAQDRSDGEQLPVAEIEEEPLPQVGVLQIVSEPSGAAVTVNGQSVGVAPVVLNNFAVGTAQVRLSLEGYAPFQTSVDVIAQQQQTVRGELRALLGTLKILAKPWGNIYIDGKLHKSEASIRYTTTVPPGNHRVRVEHPALGKWEQVVEVVAGEEQAITVDFNRGNSPSQ